EALDRALGDRSGIARFGEAYAPMDEALARAVVDISGRPLLVWGVHIGREKVGEFETELTPEFFRALTSKGKATVHIDLLRGENTHHSLEAVFKAFGRALDRATQREERVQGPPSTKGRL
ncbi:MAG TPA: imidazoleglycerol-phosphate dehydratase, partial [Candidatus Latescibacteria bacterium]|nr:imidazoleglycerol-phosphate dehydratase [Candidatus Latescibacterota bacterium]